MKRSISLTNDKSKKHKTDDILLLNNLFNINIFNLIQDFGLAYNNKHNKYIDNTTNENITPEQIVKNNFEEYNTKCKQGALSRLIDVNIKYEPIIIYDNEGFDQLKHITYQDLLKQKPISNYTPKSNVFFDGVTAFGKTFMVDLLSKYKHAKINQIFTFDNYNHNPIEAHLYVAGQLHMNKTGSGYIFDRSPISNIVFQIIFHVYKFFEDNVGTQLTMHGILDNFLKDSNIITTLKLIKYNVKNIIIFIDSDIELSKLRMQNRAHTNNTNGDAVRCLSDEYFILQNTVFSYIAKLCDYIIIDLNYYRNFVVCDGINWKLDKNKMYTLNKKKEDDGIDNNEKYNLKLLDQNIRYGIQMYVDEVCKHTLNEHRYYDISSYIPLYNIDEHYLEMKKMSSR